MAKDPAGKTADRLLSAEIGTIRKSGPERIRAALVYPNRYAVGMSNLGFQTVYRLLNRIDGVVCERAFVAGGPQKTPGPLKTLESGRPVGDADIVAFSVSFENDYTNVLTALSHAGLPLQSKDRHADHPLVIAGGVACFLNPEPLAAFIDCFLLGEAEGMLEGFIECLLQNGFPAETDRSVLLAECARRVDGIYVPRFYSPAYHEDGTLAAFSPVADVPERVSRTYLRDAAAVPTCSAVVTPHSTFDGTFLIEVGRGCPHGCRFCSAGFVYRPPRFRPLSLLQAAMQEATAVTDRIGLVGAAVSDLPGIRELCGRALQDNVRLSFSSLRADALDDELLEVLKRSRVKTATIAPDAGSERMRRVINKGIDEGTILHAAELLVTAGIPNLKLYFMVGLPTETPDDIEEIVRLCKRIKHTFLKASRGRHRIGTITVSLSAFVPKPTTPFQWAAMDDTTLLKWKIRRVREGLKTVANLRVHADIPRWAAVQALLARGDRKVAAMLLLAQKNRENWAQTFKESPLNADFYTLRTRAANERFPWDFIDHGVKKSFLAREYRRALEAKPTPPCPVTDCSVCGVCNAG